VTVWNFFNRKTCLTLNHWDEVSAEFERVGLTVERFHALPDIGPHQSFNKSTRAILSDFYESGQETLLFLEDDCVFNDLSHLEAALSELPSDWDMVYLGANLLQHSNYSKPAPVRYSTHLFRVFHAWTTHAVGYNRRVIKYLLDNQPPLSEEMFDCWMAKQLQTLRAYVVAPMVAYQRPHFSSIWIKPEVDDYTHIFVSSEEKLR